MKRLFYILAQVLWMLLLLQWVFLDKARGQCTQVVVTAGTIQDTAGNPATSGTVTFSIIPNNGSVLYRVPGCGVIEPVANCGISATGQLKNESLTGACVVRGNDVIQPANTQYQVQFNPDGVQGQLINNLLITGATYDLTHPVFGPAGVAINPQSVSINTFPLATNLLPAASSVFTIGSQTLPYSQLWVNTINGIPPSALGSQGIVNAATFPGADWSIAVNNAIASSPSGSVISLLGFTPSQLALPGSATILANKPILLNFPSGTLQFNGNPGINISAPNVILNCPASLSGTNSILKSGVAAPLIADFNNTLHATDGLQIFGCFLYGNNVGTIGIFTPNSYYKLYDRINVSGFTGPGMLDIGGAGTLTNSIIHDNGGDCIVWGFDARVISGNQANGCGKDDWHFLGGGNFIANNTSYRAGLHGMHIDGNIAGPWVNTTYVEPKLIVPTSNNAGQYAFYTLVTGATGGAQPNPWCQVVGCTVSDGAVTWINVAQGNDYNFGIGVQWPVVGWSNHVKTLNIATSNVSNAAGDWDNLLVEGTAAHYGVQSQFDDIQTDQEESPVNPVHGSHFKYLTSVIIGNINFYGSVQTSQNDLGGMYLDHVFNSQLGNMSCYFASGACETWTQSLNNIASSIIADDGGAAASPTPYALNVDSGSSGQVTSMIAKDDRGTPYQLGTCNAGTNNLFVKNQQYAGVLHAGFDCNKAFTLEFLGSDGSIAWNTTTGSAGFSWEINGVTQALLNSTGLGVQGTFSSPVIDATTGFKANGTSGVSTSFTISSCTLTFSEGLLTAHSGVGCP